MRQTLHIFQKDVRYLRWELVLLAVLLAMFVYTQVRYSETDDPIRATGAPILLACFWAFLCARLIQAETIPGDRQFWITRPYSWRSLLGAKLLFVAVCIGIPLLVADAVILALVGFSIASNAAGLLWSAAMVSIAWLVPACAFATLTRGLGPWILSALVTAGTFLALESLTFGTPRSFGSVGWMRDIFIVAILLVAASVVFLLQYRRRRTIASGVVMTIGLALAWACWNYTPVAAAFPIQTAMSKSRIAGTPMRIALHEEPKSALRRRYPAGSFPEYAHSITDHAVPAFMSPEKDDTADDQSVRTLQIPLDVFGLSKGMDMVSDSVHVTIEINGEDAKEHGQDGDTWTSDQIVSDKLQPGTNLLLQTVEVDGAFFRKATPRLVRINLTLYVTVLGNPITKVLDLGSKPERVPGVGQCSAYEKDNFNTIRCASAFRDPSNIMMAKFENQRRDWFPAASSYSPLPADFSISPLHWYWNSVAADRSRSNSPQATVTSLQPLGHFRRDLLLVHVYLNDYESRVRDFR